MAKHSYTWSKLHIFINGIKLHVHKQNNSHMLLVILSHNQGYTIMNFSDFNTTMTHPKHNYTILMIRTSLLYLKWKLILSLTLGSLQNSYFGLMSFLPLPDLALPKFYFSILIPKTPYYLLFFRNLLLLT